MKPSAPATVAPLLVTVAPMRTTACVELSGTAPLFGEYVAVTPLVLGPVPTTVSVIVANGPQLPSASWLWTETRPPETGGLIVASRLLTGD